MNTAERPPTNGRVASIEVYEHRAVAPRRKRTRALLALCAVLVLALVAASFAVVRARAAVAPAYATVPLAQGTLVQSVTATGTVDPQNTIAVGTQDSGTIGEIAVDYNSHVKRGQVLAKLDPTTFEAALAQAQAQLAQAQAQAQAAQATATGGASSLGGALATEQVDRANSAAASESARAATAAIATAQSNVTKAQSALLLAEQTMTRDGALLSQGYIAQSQVDSDQSNLVAAQTGVQSAQAALQQAKLAAAASQSQALASSAQIAAQGFAGSAAQSQAATLSANAAAAQAAVTSARAQVQGAELNLQRTVITSPVDGTVIARDVSVGETVAASFSTPTLFSIAQYLGKMEVDLAVGEPDIGNVKVGDPVNLSVLAYPNATFTGTVSQVRIDPITTNNVVTYTSVVLVDNRDGRLLPGMTANATIDVASARKGDIVPLAALSYQPSAQAVANRAQTPWGTTIGGSSAAVGAGSRGRIFVERSGKLVGVPVSVTLVSGAQAAVTPIAATPSAGTSSAGTPSTGILEAGDLVVTGDSGANAGTHAAPSARSPLTSFGGGATRGLHG